MKIYIVYRICDESKVALKAFKFECNAVKYKTECENTEEMCDGFTIREMELNENV